MIETSNKFTLKDIDNEYMNMDIKFEGGLNQQKSGENISVNRISCKGISSEIVSGRFPLSVKISVCWLCNYLHFDLFYPHKSHMRSLWVKRGHKEPMFRTKLELRKKNITQNVEPTDSLVTEQIAS